MSCVWEMGSGTVRTRSLTVIIFGPEEQGDHNPLWENASDSPDLSQSWEIVPKGFARASPKLSHLLAVVQREGTLSLARRKQDQRTGGQSWGVSKREGWS